MALPFGAGATMNGGCALGSVARLGEGRATSFFDISFLDDG
ncbi:YeeE/YedE family protein [Rhizobium leguminosarum]|nr:YeeE/YedE family protein [Rhizobium leguminosarum]